MGRHSLGERAPMALPTIVPLREGDLPAAAAALALQDDPLQTYVFPDPAERAARSPGHFAPLLRYGLQFGEVLTTTASPAGAAVWLTQRRTFGFAAIGVDAHRDARRTP